MDHLEHLQKELTRASAPDSSKTLTERLADLEAVLAKIDDYLAKNAAELDQKSLAIREAAAAARLEQLKRF